MMIQGVSINEMLSQSMTVLTKPSVQSFEQFEKRGGQREALIYVIAAAVIIAIVGLVFGLFSGVMGALSGVLRGVFALIGFYVFAFVMSYVGKTQGGTGTQDEVFYTAALYTATLLAITNVIGAIPLLNCLALPVLLVLGIYQIYLGYLAARSSMNLEQTPAIITVAAAIIAQFIVGVFIGGVIIAALVGTAAATGQLN